MRDRYGCTRFGYHKGGGLGFVNADLVDFSVHHDVAFTQDTVVFVARAGEYFDAKRLHVRNGQAVARLEPFDFRFAVERREVGNVAVVALGHELGDAAVAHALGLGLKLYFSRQILVDPVDDQIGNDGDGQRIQHDLAGSGVGSDPVFDRVAVHLVPRLHGQFGEAAGLGVDDAGTEICLVEENLQAQRVVACGFHVELRNLG